MGKKVLITGGSGNIGSSIVRKFSSDEYEVFSPSHQDLNLSNVSSIKDYFYHNNDFDILINNAGINEISNFHDFSIESIQDAVMINLTSPALLSKYVLPHMVKNEWGRIVNISSIYSKISRPKRALYTMTKSGLDGLTIGLANEYAQKGVLVNSILPGFVDTELTRKNNNSDEINKLCLERIPVGRMSTIDEVSDFVYHLGSSRNTYITGQTIAVDGGVLTL
ncbi:SDR family oxidoreductase [Candidatus Woesearchaeota archaeon]|jgi:3-oxoacyl-[acyl-carrier protein] reductase|nr:SDR family oxidoreductase [Candidatus Woesearchaeota archaeon]